jgi:hypothetical protein
MPSIHLQLAANLLQSRRRRIVGRNRLFQIPVKLLDLAENALDLRLFGLDCGRIGMALSRPEQNARQRENKDRRPPFLPGSTLSGRAPEQAPVRHKRGTLAATSDGRKSHASRIDSQICAKFAK